MGVNKNGISVKRSKYPRRGEGGVEGRSRSPRYSRRWTRAIWRKAGSKCEVCGSTDDLTAHHILDRKRFPDLRHNKHNGLLLCRECHDKRHDPDNPYLN